MALFFQINVLHDHNSVTYSFFPFRSAEHRSCGITFKFVYAAYSLDSFSIPVRKVANLDVNSN
jgi:hypothetical protein